MLLNHTHAIILTSSQVHLQYSQNLQADDLGLMAATFQRLEEESLTVKFVIFQILLRWEEDGNSGATYPI